MHARELSNFFTAYRNLGKKGRDNVKPIIFFKARASIYKLFIASRDIQPSLPRSVSALLMYELIKSGGEREKFNGRARFK